MDPEVVRKLAAKWGLKWGGDFKSVKDAMHFEALEGAHGASSPAGSVSFQSSVPSSPWTLSEQHRIEDEAARNSWTTSAATWEALKHEQMLPTLWGGLNMPAADPNYVPDESIFKKDPRFAGVGPEHWDYLMQSKSAAEMDIRLDRLKEDLQYEQKMAERGILGGTVLRMAASVLDPAAWLASEVSPVSTLGTKVGRLGRILTTGADVAFGNVAADIPQALYNPTYTRDQLLYTAAGGFLFGAGIGGAIGAIHPTIKPEVEGLMDASKSIMRDIDAPRGDAGAAINLAHVEPVRGDTYDFTSAAFKQAELGKTAHPLGLPRIDIAGRMKDSENPLVAALGGRLVEDAVGNADFTAASRAASVEAGLISDRMSAFIVKEYQSAFRDYKVRVGSSGADVERAFREQIADAIDNLDPTTRGGFDPAVTKAAQAGRDFYSRYHDLIVNPGSLDGSAMAPLRGVAELEKNPNYFPRIWDFMRFGEGARMYGDAQVQRLIRESILSARPDLDAAIADKAAKGFYKALRNVQAGQEVSLSRMVSGDDREALASFLKGGTDLSDQDIEQLVGVLTPEADKGAVARTKRRQTMNVHFEMPLKDAATGEVRGVSLKDFLERDFVAVSEMYNRTMSAQVALARLRVENPRWREGDGPDIPRYLVDGIRSDADWSTLTKQIRAVADEMNIHPDKTEADLKRLQWVYDSLTGRLGRTEKGQLGAAIRLIKDYNYLRVMNQVGFAQVAETANLISSVGIKAALSQMPSFRALMRDWKAGGRLTDDVAEQIEHMAAPGTDMLRSSTMLPVDDFGNVARDAGRLEATEGLMRKGTRLTSLISGMAPITAYQQKWMAKAALARFAMDATGEQSLNTRRMAVLGIDPAMREKIRANMQRHEGYIEGESGIKLRVLHLDKWDPDARHAMEYALYRWTRQAIQENDLGQMNTLLGSSMGKLMAQFRMFMFAAYTKQTLHALHMRDWESASMILGTSFFGALTYGAQTYLQSIGRGDQGRFLNDRLSAPKLASAAVQRGSWSSMFPMLADAGGWTLGLDPMFDTRVTGTPSQGFVSNPTLSLVDNLMNGGRGISASAMGKGEFSQRDARAIQTVLPFSNFLPFVTLGNMLMRDLPKGDTHKPKLN